MMIITKNNAVSNSQCRTAITTGSTTKRLYSYILTKHETNSWALDLADDENAWNKMHCVTQGISVFPEMELV
jgi:6-phosphogluconolactonase/glucosamine-6-phosphate isomerase/deaminase